MSNPNNLNVQNALPLEGVPGTGLFEPTVNIVPNTYNTPTGVTDSPYNTVYIGDSEDALVGTEKTPYLPMALPAYIPTLYENMYHVQTNLKNVIPGDEVQPTREYPTIYAVKQYVASQLNGSQYLVPAAGPAISISTSLTSSFLTASQVSQSDNVQVSNDPTTGMTTYTTTYSFDPIDPVRTGAEKVCINTSSLGVVSTNVTQLLQIVLTQENQRFVVNGKNYTCYVPASLGDTLNMFQFINPDTGAHLFFVISYGGLFSNGPYYK